MTNGEKYKTAKERAEAFYDYCEKEHHTVSACHVLHWLELEAEEEEPLPCPFCRSACNVLTTDDLRTDETVYYVSCTKCNYQSGDKDIKAATIAAHNRVAKAMSNSSI